MQDVPEGFINIPSEYLETHGISPEDVKAPAFRAWVHDQVEQARRYFREGKRYLDGLDVLRCKIAGYWYCARFESVLDSLDREGYLLRADNDNRSKISAWLKMVWVGFKVTFNHVTRRSAKSAASS